LTLQLKSEHLDQNFPGSIIVLAKFSIPSDSNTLMIHYTAQLDDSNPTDLNTIVNLTNHAYFNLDGCEPAEVVCQMNQPSICDHEVYSIDAKAILEQAPGQVSSGRLIKLEDGDPLFQISKGYIKLRDGCIKGLYDHSFAYEIDPKNFSTDDENKSKKSYKFEVISRQSKTKLIVQTDNLSCHMYTGPRQSILNYPPLSAVCLEAQAFANSCNIPEWRNQCLVTKEKPYSKYISFTFENL